MPIIRLPIKCGNKTEHNSNGNMDKITKIVAPREISITNLAINPITEQTHFPYLAFS